MKIVLDADRKITQVELKSGNKKLVCWLPAENKLKPGMSLTLKKEHEMWDVVNVFTTQEHFEVNRKWDVGGYETRHD